MTKVEIKEKVMKTKKLIESELENLTEEQLNQVYVVIKNLNDSVTVETKPSLMSKLSQIKIDAPENFSTQIADSLGRDISEE